MSSRRRIDEERLTEASLAEFASKSYEEASVNTIIDCAGISKGSFYYRFKTKYDLYLHLLKTGVEKKWAHIRSRIETSGVDLEDHDAALSRIIEEATIRPFVPIYSPHAVVCDELPPDKTNPGCDPPANVS